MAYLNRFECVGNIGRDIEVRVFPESGTRIGRTSIALTKVWKKKDGTKGDKTTWVNIAFPEHLVENAEKFVTKGRQVFIEGELDIREYDKDGVKHFAHEIRVESFQLLGQRPAENGTSMGDGYDG